MMVVATHLNCLKIIFFNINFDYYILLHVINAFNILFNHQKIFYYKIQGAIKLQEKGRNKQIVQNTKLYPMIIIQLFLEIFL